jgi:hypothetical protein
MCRDGYAGKFNVVIVWKFDRFTRDVETGVASFFGLKNKGIKIVSLQDGVTSDSDDMMSLLSIGMAAKYRKDLIVNIKRGTRTKLKQGDPRIGLAGQPIARYWDEKDRIFKLKEDEAAAIIEEGESEEIIVASGDPPGEAPELTLRDEPTTVEPSQETAATQQQPGKQDGMEKPRKWHPKRKRRKFHQKKTTQ